MRKDSGQRVLRPRAQGPPDFKTKKRNSVSKNNQNCKTKDVADNKRRSSYDVINNRKISETREPIVDKPNIQAKADGLFESILASERTKEKKINTEKKVVFRDGKWIEETLETTTVLGKNGHETTSYKTSTKELNPDFAQDKRKIAKLTDLPREVSQNRVSSLKAKERAVRATDNQKLFADQMTNKMNRKRILHGSSPLDLSARLCNLARNWADKLADAQQMKHTHRKDIGENIYLRTSLDPWFEVKAEDVCENWYREVKLHNYSSEPGPGVIVSGHFTQMVWKDSKEVGIGFARNKTGNMMFVVAFFSPKGNWIGEFKKNVLPVQSRPTQASVKSYGVQAPKELDFNQKCLESHNKHRAKHGVPPLTVDPKLTRFAVSWANKLARENRLSHYPDNDHGENLYTIWSSNPNFVPDGEDAPLSWYSEIKDYNFNREVNDLKNTGHFSQMVWKATTKIGIGKAKSKDGKWFIVAEYSPPGNIISQYKANVPKPIA